jgi:transcriptional regulator with XRE-family HTH domain
MSSRWPEAARNPGIIAAWHAFGVRDVEFGRAVRALRRRRGWRQIDLADRAGLHRSTVSLLERGELRLQSVQAIRRCLAPLGATAEVMPRWRGPALERLLDERHALLQAAWKLRLGRWGWLVDAEASFNRYGERGRVDLLASHSTARALLVVEIKTELVNLQELLGTLDVKARLGPILARERRWPRPATVVRVLIVRDTPTARRRVATFGPLFDSFGLRGRDAVGWLAHPERPGALPTGLLIFSDLSPAAVMRARQVDGQRVRGRRLRSSVEGGLNGPVRDPGPSNANQDGI